MRKRIVRWIRVQVKQSGAKGVVMGLSGGLDSSVTAALAKEALGKNRLLSLILPCHSHSRDLKDAETVARKLKIRAKTVDLGPIYDNLIKILPKAEGLSVHNLKPRLRMIALYYFANKLNYLVCGTGNKSELMMGYFSKYGDGGVDILPLGGLLKKDVKKLAQQLNLPCQIIEKAPSAGLWPGQTDEGEMGITYKELDDILERIDKKKRQASARKKVEMVKKAIRQSEHKRKGPQICPA
ncbi:MAG: NAD(+) synthase [Candidatus Omnitrophota bacterium]